MKLTTPSPPPARRRSRAMLVRWIRLATGLILFTYLTTHLANHALGLISLSAMEAGRSWFLVLWRNPVGTLALYGALAVHLALALWSLYQRRHFRMPAWEALQLLLGLLIPPLLVSHVVGTRLAHAWFDVTDSYARTVLTLWELRPEAGARQAIVLALAWTHGCMGLHFWLRFRRWYPRWSLSLFAGALLLPVFALLGFAHAGREVSALAREPGWREHMLRATNSPDPTERAMLDLVYNAVLGAFAASLGLVLVAHGARRVASPRRATIRIVYPEGREVVVPVGFTVLEASRFAGVPHASVCGGRGRCSTCRIRVVHGLERLPPASQEEHHVLARVGAPHDVRLACQVRPTRDLSIVPLLPVGLAPVEGAWRREDLAGDEREIAVLFADVRGFTEIAERKLPYDVVFVLNRYFEAVGGAIERAGGTVNQFTGDGVMALFGVETGAEEGCRAALVAASEIVRSVAELSRALSDELDAPLRIGIGVHTGPAVVGRMGYGRAAYLTAVGDTVHVASRLEQLTKEYGALLVISEPVAVRAGIDVSMLPRHDQFVRNRREPLPIRVVHDPHALVEKLRPAQTS